MDAELKQIGAEEDPGSEHRPDTLHLNVSPAAKLAHRASHPIQQET